MPSVAAATSRATERGAHRGVPHGPREPRPEDRDRAEPGVGDPLGARGPAESVGLADGGRQERGGQQPHRRQQRPRLRAGASACLRQQRTGDGPRLVAHVEASRAGRTTIASNSARVSGQPCARPPGAGCRAGVAAHDRVGGRPRRAVPRDARAASSATASERRRDPALGVGVEGAVRRLDRRRRRPARARGRAFTARTAASRELVVAEADRVDVVERAEQAVEAGARGSRCAGRRRARHAGRRAAGGSRHRRRAAARPPRRGGGTPRVRRGRPSVPVVRHQYQLVASEWAHAPHGEP